MFRDAELNTTGSNRQTVSAPVQDQRRHQGKADSPLLAGLGGLFSARPLRLMKRPTIPVKEKEEKETTLKIIGTWKIT